MSVIVSIYINARLNISQAKKIMRDFVSTLYYFINYWPVSNVFRNLQQKVNMYKVYTHTSVYFLNIQDSFKLELHPRFIYFYNVKRPA